MRRKKYWNVLLLAAAGAVLMAGCSQKDSAPASSAAAGDTQAAGETAEAAEESADLLAQIQERGTIIIAMEGTWAPWTYHDEDDNLVGYDVEVGQHIAESLGVEPEFVEGEWDGLLAGLDAGRYDIMINGVNITEDRAQSYDFSEPYAYNRTAVIVRADNTDIQSMEDLAGKHTANTISSTYAEVAESYGAEVTGVDDLNQTFELLLSGRIDATLNEEVTYYDYMKAHPDANMKIAVLSDDVMEVAIPFRKGDDTASLREAVNGILEEMHADGTLSELSVKYFGTDISQKDAGAAESAEADNFSADPEAVKDFAAQLQLVTASKDLQGLADLTAFPVYVASADGAVETKEAFLALDPEQVFTKALQDAVAAADISALEPSEAGFVVSGDGAASNIIFGMVDGALEVKGINN